MDAVQVAALCRWSHPSPTASPAAGGELGLCTAMQNLCSCSCAFLLHHLCYFSSFLSPLSADCSHQSLLSLFLPSSVHLCPHSPELLWHGPLVAWGGERWEQGRADHLSETRNQSSSTSKTPVSGSGCCPRVDRTEDMGYRWSQSVLMAFLWMLW